MKRKHFWTIEEMLDCSWSLRGLLKHRKLARKLIKYTIANGADTFLWHDLWADSAPLLEDVEEIQLLNLPMKTNVSHLISNGVWNEHITSLQDCALKSKILATQINHLLDKNEIVWAVSPSGKFTSRSAYDNLCKGGAKVRWHGVV